MDSPKDTAPLVGLDKEPRNVQVKKLNTRLIALTVVMGLSLVLMIAPFHGAVTVVTYSGNDVVPWKDAVLPGSYEKEKGIIHDVEMIEILEEDQKRSTQGLDAKAITTAPDSKKNADQADQLFVDRLLPLSKYGKKLNGKIEHAELDVLSHNVAKKEESVKLLVGNTDVKNDSVSLKNESIFPILLVKTEPMKMS